LNSNKRIVVVLLVVVLLGVGATTTLYLLSIGATPGSRPLPPGCVKPADGYLIVASSTGYNDSIGHGAPEKNWPIITVKQGQNVTIVVCDVDVQAHGFQIAHYWAPPPVVTIVPGQVYTVNFIASQVGSFQIYCDIFCSIHVYMQSGQLNVTAT
jgi:hypothetical protein